MRARAHALSSIAGVSAMQLINTNVIHKPITDVVHVTSDPKEQIGIYATILIGTLIGSSLPDIDYNWASGTGLSPIPFGFWRSLGTCGNSQKTSHKRPSNQL